MVSFTDWVRCFQIYTHTAWTPRLSIQQGMVWFSIGYTWYMVTIWKSYHSSYSTCINIPGVNAGWQQHLISLLWLWGNEKNISIEGPLLENLCIITVHLKLYCFTFQVGSQKSQLPFRSAKPPQFKFDLKKRKKGRKTPIITHFTLSVVKLKRF